jgi:hypothetical protein
MKLLDVKDYYKVLNPLKKLKFNTLFAKTVITQKISSAIYVDDVINPNAFYIAHPYGMSLLFGQSDDEEFLDGLKDYILNKNNVRFQREWLQFYPNDWVSILDDLLGEDMFMSDKEFLSLKEDDSSKVVKSIRLNFQFSINRFNALKNSCEFSGCEVVSTSRDMFDKIEGLVVPKIFWKDSEQFEKEGKGFSLICEGELASTAFASFADVGKLELGIETSENHRKKGYATEVSVALIEYCIENNLEPVWSCNITNTGSASLAQKLGFVKSVTLPYYRLVF